MLDWNGLRTVLALSRARNATEAAQTLAVHPSTVFRRLGTMEQELGVRFFHRVADGYIPTAAGEEACAVAERVETEIAVLGRHLASHDLRPSGILRVTTTDTLVALLTPDLAIFRQRYPEIELRLEITNRFFDLTRHDADIAIRPTLNPPENLVGRRMATIATAIYASDAYLAGQPASGELAEHAWIGLDESLGHLPFARWLKTSLPSSRVDYRVNSLMAALEAVKAGLGLCALPIFLGDPEPSLSRVRPPQAELDSALWLLTHPDLRHVARVRAFMDFAAEALGTQRSRFEGD